MQTILQDLLESGKEPLVILQSITSFYRDLLIAKTSPSKHSMVSLTEATWKQLCQFAVSWESSTILLSQQHLRQCETQVKLSSQPQLWLEISVLGLLPSALPPVSKTSTTSATSVNLDMLRQWYMKAKQLNKPQPYLGWITTVASEFKQGKVLSEETMNQLKNDLSCTL